MIERGAEVGDPNLAGEQAERLLRWSTFLSIFPSSSFSPPLHVISSLRPCEAQKKVNNATPSYHQRVGIPIQKLATVATDNQVSLEGRGGPSPNGQGGNRKLGGGEARTTSEKGQ